MQTPEFFERLYTFYALPTNLPHQLYTYDLAAEGFIYIGSQYPDLVGCKDCGLLLSEWTKEADPEDEHQRYSPDCPFVKACPAQPILLTPQAIQRFLPEPDLAQKAVAKMKQTLKQAYTVLPYSTNPHTNEQRHKLTRQLIQSAFRQAPQPAAETPHKTPAETPAKTAILEISLTQAEHKEPPGKQYAQQQKHVASQPPTQSATK